MFFSFDGVDGAGKSTQIKLFARWLRDHGREVVECRDPGTTQLGESLREILLGHHDQSIHIRSEMLIYMAARAQMVEEIIRPALDAGKIVVSDRFLLANVAYQAYAGGLDPEETWQVGTVATAGVQPIRTFLLDMDVDNAAGRIDRAADRLEQRGSEYFRRVRQGFLDEAARQPNRIIVVDASRSVEQVQESIREATTPLLK